MSSHSPPQELPQLIATDQILPTMRRIVAELQAVREEVAQVRPEAACFETVARPLINVENRTDGEMSIIAMLRYASPDADARAASDEACKLWAECGAELATKADLYELFKRVRVDPGDREAAKYVDSLLTDFVRAGHGRLSQAEIDRHVSLVSRIDDMRREFNRNVRDDTQFLRFSLEELRGVPRQHLERFRENAGDDPGGFHVQLRRGDMTVLLEHAEDPRTRERIYIANMTQRQRNIELFKDIITYRCEHALLLGYASHADYRLEKRVAKSPDWVFRLFENLEEAVSGKGRCEMDVLMKMRDEDRSRNPERFSSYPAGDFPPWDYHYYSRLLAAESSVDQLKIAEYFPLQHVISVMLELFATCLQLNFVPVPPDQSQGSRWHDDVEVWSVWDERAGVRKNDFVGYLFMDLLSRPNKYQGSQNVTLQAGYTDENGRRVHPATLLVCSFPRPNDLPCALLRHAELVSLFHELGHGIHDLVSRTSLVKFHGHRAPPDFAEAPSVMLENWCWMKDELRRMSRHYSHLSPKHQDLWQAEHPGETAPSERIPDDLLDSLIASRSLNRALWFLRQLVYARFDMTVHHLKSPEECTALDLPALYSDLMERLTFMHYPDAQRSSHGYADFTHIVSGYDAGYYSYLSAQVFAADLFETNFASNPRDQEAWERYRVAVLEPGGSRDELQMLEEFLGHAPSPRALFGSFDHHAP